jgi:transposase
MAKARKLTLITSEVDPDLAEVKRFIKARLAEGAIAALIAAILTLLTRMRDLNTELAKRLEAARRARPPSETLQRLQMELPFWGKKPDNDADDGAEQDGAEKAPKKGRKKRGPREKDLHGRPKLPAHLERVPDRRLVPDEQRTCPTCEVEAAHVTFKPGAEKLELVPARFVVSQALHEVVACSCCHEYIVSAPKPDEIVDRGIIGDELAVQATVDHYENAVPWERMEREARKQGVPLCANTLAATCGKLIDLFDPVVDHIFKRVVTATYTALDATSLPVLDIDHPLGIRTGTLWLLQGERAYSYFMYAESGHAHHLDKKLKGYKLASVMCDGSATNNCVERAGGDRGGCNAHARRKLVEAVRGGDQRAVMGLELFAKIFHVDAEAKRAGESISERFLRRQRESAPLVAELKTWVRERRQDVEPKCPLGKALSYIHKQWDRLTRFLYDPVMELTNNDVERGLRTWVLDRKTWMFCGHDRSARRAADALTIITTCKNLGIDPRSYMRDTLRRILSGEKSLDALVPENYRAGSVEPARDEAPAALHAA